LIEVEERMVVVMPERRSHRRIVTLQNAGKAVLVLVVLFVAVTLVSQIRRPKPGELGRLSARESPKNQVVTKRIEVVTEAPVAPQPAAELVDSVSPQQPVWSRDETPAIPERKEPPDPGTKGDHVTVVGGPDGVMIQRSAGQNQPVKHLSGGFNRH
jgi:hypothetical protein